MEDGLRLLIALFDSAQAKQPPRQDDFWGAASLATYSCAFYCEMALKTIIVGLRPDLVSVLARVPPWFSKKNLPPELHTHNLRKLYDEAAGLLPASEQTLGESAIEFARDGGGHMPLEWIPESVEDVLATDSTSFVDWRYGLAEGDDDIVGSPKSFVCPGKGPDSVCQRALRVEVPRRCSPFSRDDIDTVADDETPSRTRWCGLGGQPRRPAWLLRYVIPFGKVSGTRSSRSTRACPSRTKCTR